MQVYHIAGGYTTTKESGCKSRKIGSEAFEVACPDAVITDARRILLFQFFVRSSEPVKGRLEFAAKVTVGECVHVFGRQLEVQRDVGRLLAESFERPAADLGEICGNVKKDFLAVLGT